QLQALLTTAPDSPFPLNRSTFNLLASSNGASPLIQNSSTGSVRVDYGLSEQDFIFLRGSLTNDSQHNVGVGGQFAPSSGFDIGSRDNTNVPGETHVFRSGASNEFRFQLVRNTYNVNTVDPFGPRIRLAGIGVFGREFRSPSERAQRRFQFIDNFSLPAGRHNLKFGADFSRYNIGTATAIFLGGNIDFGSSIPLGFVLNQVLQVSPLQFLTNLANPPAIGGLGRSDIAQLAQTVSMQPLSVVQQASFGFARSI